MWAGAETEAGTETGMGVGADLETVVAIEDPDIMVGMRDRDNPFVKL